MRALRSVLRSLCVVSALWIVGVLPTLSATRHVVLLFDERAQLPGLAAIDAEFMRTLAASSADQFEIYREAMDLSRFNTGSYYLALRDFLRLKYANKKIDVVVGVLSPALDFLLNYGDEIFPGAFVVFCGIDRRELGDRSLPPHARGVLVKREFAPTVDVVLRLHPKTKRVVVVAGTSEFDTRLLEQARKDLQPYEDRLAFTYMTALPLQELLLEVSRLPPQTIVLFTTLFQDGTGEAFVPHDVVQRVSTAASVPVYGFVDQYLGRGIVGGSLYSLSAQGAEAAKQVFEILAGAKRSEPALLEAQTSKVLLDWHQMQRWGINESDLPAGSEIRFRDLTPWGQYRNLILALGGALLLQAVLIFWLIYEHRRRSLAEVVARDSIAELAHTNRTSTAGELAASIAHEVNQPLAAIGVYAHAASNWLTPAKLNAEEVRTALEQIKQASVRAGDIIHNLRAMFEKDTRDEGLVDVNKVILAVLALTRMEAQKYAVEVRTRLEDRLPPIRGVEIQLQQIILNLVMNAIEAMHSIAGSRELTLKSELAGNDLRVSVEDTGHGIAPSDVQRVFEPMFTTKARGMGMGLPICRSIIERHKGRIWASARAGGGAIFAFALPAQHEVGHTA